MARGWESKAVESQIEAAETRKQQAEAVQKSAEQVSREREKESIELSRTRVLQDLAAASNPKYRELLEKSLQYLDAKLAEMN